MSLDERGRSANDISRRDLLKRGGTGLGVLVGGPALLAACGAASKGVTTEAGKPRRGGILHAGLTGGSTSDTFDPAMALTVPDYARAAAVFECLIGADDQGLPTRHILAEIFEPNKTATEWTIRVRDGVTFHNGMPLTADDVLYTFQRILNPKAPLVGAGPISVMDFSAAKKLDKLTLRVPAKTPFSIFDQIVAAGLAGGNGNYAIVPEGFNPKRPIGTGAFKYVSFTPNQQTVLTRYEDYWQSGRPYLDGVVITEYANETSQVNALLSGQEDAITAISYGSTSEIKSSGMSVLTSKSGAWLPFVMNMSTGAFKDVRVRQALRLIIDRPQMMNQVFGGAGTLGNDVFGKLSPEYNTALPQRQQDISQAKSLLKAAGQSGLSVQLTTGALGPGATEMAQVFAQQAVAAGVKINLNNQSPTVIYGSEYTKWPFTQNYWFNSTYLTEAGFCLLPTSLYPETHFDNPQYTKMYNEATASTNESRRVELIHEMQKLDYDLGGYIIPLFLPVIDGYAPGVGGVRPTTSGLSMNDYVFTDIYKA